MEPGRRAWPGGPKGADTVVTPLKLIVKFPSASVSECVDHSDRDDGETSHLSGATCLPSPGIRAEQCVVRVSELGSPPKGSAEGCTVRKSHGGERKEQTPIVCQGLKLSVCNQGLRCCWTVPASVPERRLKLWSAKLGGFPGSWCWGIACFCAIFC